MPTHKPIPGDPSDPHGLTALLQRYLTWIETHHFAKNTVDIRRLHLSRFIVWCEERSVTQARDVTFAMVERYQHHLFHYGNALLHRIAARRSIEPSSLGLGSPSPRGPGTSGKGNKDRFAPIGERALAWIDKYLNEVRPKSTREPILVGGCADRVPVRSIFAAVRGYRWQQSGRSQGGFCSSPKACSGR